MIKALLVFDMSTVFSLRPGMTAGDLKALYQAMATDTKDARAFRVSMHPGYPILADDYKFQKCDSPCVVVEEDECLTQSPPWKTRIRKWLASLVKSR